MSTARYVHWQNAGIWLGYFEHFPDYLTQGETLEELEGNLRDLYRDLTSNEIPGIRKVAQLAVGRSGSISFARSKKPGAFSFDMVENTTGIPIQKPACHSRCPVTKT
jgi:hypothetical protein